MPYCCVCQQTVDHWLPHPHIAQRSPLMVMLDTVGSDPAVYLCPACHCTDRDRHLWLYMNKTGLLGRLQGASILHMAPERHLEAVFESCAPAHYVRGDLYPTQPHHQRIDLEALPFADGSLDLVICNHVLEHVLRPEVALAEIARCLGPGGILIAQTPYAPVLKRTFELHTVPDAETAKLLFGQEDHVRLFGGDIADYFHAAGLQGELLQHDSVLAEFDPADFGCNRHEPFFVFWKPQASEPAPTAQAAKPEPEPELALLA